MPGRGEEGRDSIMMVVKVRLMAGNSGSILIMFLRCRFMVFSAYRGFVWLFW